MDNEFLKDLATFLAGMIATLLFYFSLLFIFGDGSGDIPPLIRVWN